MSENPGDELRRLVQQRAELIGEEARLRAMGTFRGLRTNADKTLYFIRCGDAIKVGVSDDPERRIKDLQTGAPGPLHLIAQFPKKGHLEHECHKRLEHLRVYGEWFRFDFEVNQLIEELSNGRL